MENHDIMSIKIDFEYSNHLLCADDALLIGQDVRKLQKMLGELTITLKK